MKKKIILLISACLILTVKPSGIDASAAKLSTRAVTSSISGNQSEDAELPDTKSIQEDGQDKIEDGVPGQESEEIQPGKDGEETQSREENGETQMEKDSEETPTGKEDEDTKPEKENEGTKPKEKPYKTRLSLGLLLYKGDTTSVGIRYLKKDIHEAASSNPSVVKVSKKGKIKALKCGKANVKIDLENDAHRDELVLHVRVKASSYKKTGSHGEGAVKMKRASQAGLAAYRELAPGKALSLKASAKSDGSKITYRSSNVSVAKVDGKGTVTAKKQGACTVRVLFRSGKKKTVYRIRLYVKAPQGLDITNGQKDAYFNGSVMVGNSLGVGLASYCRQQYAGFLGNARHFSSGSFSLMNDMLPISASSLHPTYNGVKYRVKDALKVMGAQKAFLSFGMNDLNIYGVQGTANVYQQFVRELQNNNKGLKVYIVSQTPVRRTSGRLENGSIRGFNRLMEAYAQKTKDVYFIDIFPSFLDSVGLLASQYCSDGFCHLTNAGYAVWTGQLKQFAGQQIAKEVQASDALMTVKESRLKQDYQAAKKTVEKLDLGELRTKYLGELKKVKGKLIS